MKRNINNTNNVDKLIFMADNAKVDHLSPQVIEDRDKQLEFMAGIDRMWLDKNPKVDFALQQPVKDSVWNAYQRMLNNHGSDFH